MEMNSYTEWQIPYILQGEEEPGIQLSESGP